MGITNHAFDSLTPNSIIDETAEWVNGVYSIDEQDYVHGGVHGYANVPHEQLANRTAYLKVALENADMRLQNIASNLDNVQITLFNELARLQNSILIMQEELQSFEQESDSRDVNLSIRIDELVENINKLEQQLNDHTHDYAGSDTPGGPANTLSTVSSGDRMYVLGVTPLDLISVKRSTTVQIIGGTVEAIEFAGDLRGNALTANKLKTPFNLSATGEVLGVATIDGGSDTTMALSLMKQPAVKAGWYGVREDTILDKISSILMPAIHVNSAGVITKIEDHVITLPNAAKSSTAGALPADGKLYLIGSREQEKISETNTSNGAYVVNGQLYSLDDIVVTVYNRQNIVNKTYNGFTLGSACERGVDDTPGGTLGAKTLITSDAVAQGLQAVVDNVVTAATGLSYLGTGEGHLLTGNSDDNLIGLSKATIDLDGHLTINELTTKSAHISDTLDIPGGGSIWIDKAVVSASTDAPSTVDEALETLRKRISRLEEIVDELTTISEE